jgi:hypothetical protein
MIYVVVYLALCLLVPFGNDRGRQNTTLLFVVLVFLFLFVGFRWEVGCDWQGYEKIFYATMGKEAVELIGEREPGFALLNGLVQYLGLDYYYVNVGTALLFFGCLFLFAKRQANPLAIVALAFPVLIVNMPMSGIRQGVAIGFIMLAINAYGDGRRWLYAALVLLASTFHQSALIFLGLAPLIRIEKTVATVGLAAILTLPALYFLSSSTVGFYAERYSGDFGDAAGAPFRAALLALVGVGFLLFMRKRWRSSYPNDYELYLISAVFMIAVLPLTFFASVIGDRFGYYLIPFQLVMLERVTILFKRDALASVYGAAPYLALLIFFVGWIAASTHVDICYVPYRSTLFGLE